MNLREITVRGLAAALVAMAAAGTWAACNPSPSPSDGTPDVATVVDDPGAPPAEEAVVEVAFPGFTPPCTPCVTGADCTGGFCGQYSGDSYCAPSCADGLCPDGLHCVAIRTEAGAPEQGCLPGTERCDEPVGPDAVEVDDPGTPSEDPGPPPVDPGPTPPDPGTSACAGLVPPETPSCCSACTAGGGSTCQMNGCFGGWFCNSATCKCNQATGCPAGGDSGPSDPGGSDPGPTDPGTVTPIGGTPLATLRFAIVGDTRPASIDDTSGYPSDIISKIWQDVAAEQTDFAITTGDYCFAKTTNGQSGPQMDLYVQAQAPYHGPVLHAMGNHECTGATASNCGAGNKDGTPANYNEFLAKLLKPEGYSSPYYSAYYQAKDLAWTAKVVVIAANAWSADQATWLDAELAKPSTYTFIVRHEPKATSQTPGVSPSNTIIAKHPYTLLIVGHTHTYQHSAGLRQVIVGNGGAPLTGGVDYGYVIGERQPDGTVRFTGHNYQTKAVTDQFAVRPDGTAAP